MMLTIVVVLCAGSPPGNVSKYIHTQSSVDPNKVLIVYLSRTNNTKALAEIIYKDTGGKLKRMNPDFCLHLKPRSTALKNMMSYSSVSQPGE